MTQEERTGVSVQQLFQALNAKNLAPLPLAADAEFHGALMPEPIRGESAVRSHLADIAPFLRRVELLEQVAEPGAVAARALLESINGHRLEGAFFLRTRGDALQVIRFIFDTRPLFSGSSRT